VQPVSVTRPCDRITRTCETFGGKPAQFDEYVALVYAARRFARWRGPRFGSPYRRRTGRYRWDADRQCSDVASSDHALRASAREYARSDNQRKETGMTFHAGDRVVAESESTERRARYGTVREVVHEDPRARYRIEWDDGRTSIYTPAAGALQLVRENAKEG